MKISRFLDAYLTTCTWFSYIINIFLLAYLIINRFLSKQTFSIEQDLVYYLNAIIVSFCLLMALVPEALYMSMTKSLGEFTQLQLVKDRKLLFKKMGAIEKMGKIDCIVFEQQGSLCLPDEMTLKTCFVFGQDNLSDDTDSFKDESDDLNSEKIYNSDSRLSKAMYGENHEANRPILQVATECMFYSCSARIE